MSNLADVLSAGRGDVTVARHRDWVRIPGNDIDEWAPSQLDQWLADELWECAYQHCNHEVLMPAPEWFVRACQQVWAFRREHGL